MIVINRTPHIRIRAMKPTIGPVLRGADWTDERGGREDKRKEGLENSLSPWPLRVQPSMQVQSRVKQWYFGKPSVPFPKKRKASYKGICRVSQHRGGNERVERRQK